MIFIKIQHATITLYNITTFCDIFNTIYFFVGLQDIWHVMHKTGVIFPETDVLSVLQTSYLSASHPLNFPPPSLLLQPSQQQSSQICEIKHLFPKRDFPNGGRETVGPNPDWPNIVTCRTYGMFEKRLTSIQFKLSLRADYNRWGERIENLQVMLMHLSDIKKNAFIYFQETPKHLLGQCELNDKPITVNETRREAAVQIVKSITLYAIRH